MLGKIDKAKSVLLEIVNSTRGYSYTVLNLCVQRLFTAVHSTANTIRNNSNGSTNSIADSVNMSATYLGRVIKKTKRESVSDMINNYRLEKAKDLLETTQHPVHEITESVGISNEPYFYTLFKKRFGITPNEYSKNIEAG